MSAQQQRGVSGKGNQTSFLGGGAPDLSAAQKRAAQLPTPKRDDLPEWATTGATVALVHMEGARVIRVERGSLKVLTQHTVVQLADNENQRFTSFGTANDSGDAVRFHDNQEWTQRSWRITPPGSATHQEATQKLSASNTRFRMRKASKDFDAAMQEHPADWREQAREHIAILERTIGNYEDRFGLRQGSDPDE